MRFPLSCGDLRFIMGLLSVEIWGDSDDGPVLLEFFDDRGDHQLYQASLQAIWQVLVVKRAPLAVCTHSP